jgi:hypothetical protein
MTNDFPAIIRNSGQMRGSIVPDLVYIDLEHIYRNVDYKVLRASQAGSAP